MAKPNKKRGALLKAIGAAVLLLSFVSQSFLYESWRQRASALRGLAQLRFDTEQAVAIDELTYLTVTAKGAAAMSDKEAEVAREKLAAAVNRFTLNEMARYGLLLDIDPDLSRTTTVLLAERDKIRSYDDFRRFKSQVRDLTLASSTKASMAHEVVLQRQRTAQWVYLLLYLGGTCLALLGLWYDWRGADE